MPLYICICIYFKFYTSIRLETIGNANVTLFDGLETLFVVVMPRGFGILIQKNKKKFHKFLVCSLSKYKKNSKISRS